MRAGFLAAALAVLANASPVPQDIDLPLVIAAPDPTYTIIPGLTDQVVTYNTQALQAEATSVTSVTVQSVAAADPTDNAKLIKRGNCAAQPTGATGAPSVSPDTPSAFATNAALASVALNAPVPSGYVKAFENVNASNNAYGVGHPISNCLSSSHLTDLSSNSTLATPPCRPTTLKLVRPNATRSRAANLSTSCSSAIPVSILAMRVRIQPPLP
jgi:hypothetical protein